MSDEDQSSLGEDFSASEDEWKPGQSDSDFEDDNPSFRKGEHLSSSSRSDGNSKRTKKRKTAGTSLRTKLFNKYKPPPKTVRNMSTPSKPVEKVRNAAQAKKRVSRAIKQHNSSDSDSSGDDYLVNPNELDLQSSFFDVKPSTSSACAAQNDVPPHFDCNAGMQLTDSEEYDDDDDDSESIKDIGKQNSSKSEKTNEVDLSYLQDFANNMENAKIQYNKQKDRSQLSGDTKVDVSSLLAMGEGSATSTAPIKKTKNPKRQPKKTRPTQAAAETDSDWEEVEGEGDVEQTSQMTEALANGIQVCIDLPQNQRRDKKAVDVEASLKRHLNRLIKENQVWLHKVSLLCHISHGLFLNKTINTIELMPMALKLLPSKNVYPSGQTEIKYFQSMITWFKTVMKIQDDCIYPKFKVDPVTSIAIQLNNRKAFCKRDYILMFIILLRAMGMQCRLVINMVPMPLRPNPNSLCSLKAKPAAEKADEKKVSKKEVKSVKKEKVQAKKVTIKSPPLSQEESDELRKKVQALETEIQKKKLQQLKAKRSFEEELEETASTSVKATKSIKKSESKTVDTKEETLELKRKSLDKSTKPEKKAKTDAKVSPYFNEASKAKRSFQEELKETASTSVRATKSIKKSEPKTMETKEASTELKMTSFEKSTKLEKTAKTDATISPYFNESGKGKEQQNTLTNLASHSKSFDDQQPSVSVNLQKTTKLASKTRKVNSTATKGKQQQNTKKAVPEIVLVGDEKKNLENITNKSQPKKKTDKRSRSISPKAFISTDFLQTKASKALHAEGEKSEEKRSRSKSPNPIKATVKIKLNQPSPRKLRSKSKLTVPQLDGADDVPKKSRKQNLKKPKMDSDDDFQPSVPKKAKEVERLKKIDRRVLSSDMEEEQSPSKSKKNAINMWVEVYCELEAQWVCVDLFKGKINCVDSIRKSVSPSTLAYVLAYNNDTTVKDVTPRYCAQWATVVRKSRVEQTWIDEALREYVTTHRTQRDLTEDMDLRRIHLDKPMPTTISEYKDNPLYALERHLLKFQAIYPPNALTLGFVRGEPVYARECVHTLHSREIWLKSARVVKLGEKPYKIVKARPKWDKFTSSVIKDQPLEIFGYWQTQDYEPPTAENGIVPRNAYGNVELFKECMLPKKTVHLHLPGLNKVCKKLGIDCVPAVIGFDFHQGSCHPLYDGFVVCEEFAEIAADAWDKEQQEAERKEQEKYESRVYGNWKKLIRGLLIREHLKLKYKF